MLGEHRRGAELAQQRDEGRRAEALVPRLHHVADAAAVERRRQELEESARNRLVEFLDRRELPEQRTEPVAQLEHAGVEEVLDRVAGLGEHAALVT